MLESTEAETTMPFFLRVTLSVIVIGYLALCAGLFFFQRSLIYYPQPKSPDDNTTTITLPPQVLVSVRPKETPRALIYFGGNAEDVSYNMPSFSETFPDTALYLMHYRGYGGSSGKPTEKALFADALALFDQVHTQHPEVTVIGRSLGTGVAAYLASQRPVSRLVLVTPFDSLQEIAASQYPYVPVRWLLQDKFESWRYAPNITAPTVIIAAQNDKVIPHTSTEQLFTRFKKGVATFHQIANVVHNNIADSPDYLPLLRPSP